VTYSACHLAVSFRALPLPVLLSINGLSPRLRASSLFFRSVPGVRSDRLSRPRRSLGKMESRFFRPRELKEKEEEGISPRRISILFRKNQIQNLLI